MLDSHHETTLATPYTLPHLPGWSDSGDRAVAVELVITVFSRVLNLRAFNTDVLSWFFPVEEYRLALSY